MKKKKLTKKDREYIVKWVVIFSLGLLIFLSVTKLNLGEVAYNTRYNYYSKTQDIDDIFVNYVVKKCLERETDIQKVYCINYEVTRSFEHKSRNSIFDIKKPIESVIDEGNCRDSSRIYTSILDRFGIKNKAVLIDCHIFNIAYGNCSNNWYCILDQDNIFCLEDEEKNI